MSKIICDICGTVYPDTAAVCPICGFPQKESDNTVDSAIVPGVAFGSAAAASTAKNKGGRFSNKNVKKRNQIDSDQEPRAKREKPEKTQRQEESMEPENDYVEEERGSNRGLAIIAIILAIAVLLVGGYIISRFFGGRDAYDNPNAPIIGTNPSTETTQPVETEPVETGVPCAGMTVSDASVEFLGINRSWKLVIHPTPADTTDELTFASSDESVVLVTPDGRLTSVGPGTATITITCGDVVKECEVVCDFEIETEPVETDIPCTDMTISDTSVKFQEANRSWKLNVQTSPADTTDKLIFTSSDESVVKVTSDGNLTSVGSGTATITITCGDVVKECQITCDFDNEAKPTEPDGSGLKLSHEDVSLFYEGESFTISAKWDGQWLGNAQISWASNDPNVVKVENGKVTAVGGGYTTITATYNGKTATCIVRCRFEEGNEPEETTKPTEGDTSAAKWSISDTDVTIYVAESFTLRITDENGNVANVSWSASTPGIVNVNGNTVTGAVTGKTTLTATVDGQTFSCIVRVR